MISIPFVDSRGFVNVSRIPNFQWSPTLNIADVLMAIRTYFFVLLLLYLYVLRMSLYGIAPPLSIPIACARCPSLLALLTFHPAPSIHNPPIGEAMKDKASIDASYRLINKEFVEQPPADRIESAFT